VNATRKMNLFGLVFGMGFGFVLAAAQLHEYDTIHAMLRLDEADVFLLMGAAIGVSLPLLAWLERRKVTTLYGGPLVLSRSKPQRHHVVGGALFGTGWAVAGTCPAPALAMVSSGAVLGLVAIGGLFAGLSLRDAHVRRAPVGSDGEDNPAAPATSTAGARAG
jgi:uncharacterized protein